jgi:hypothetical protein
MRLMCLTGLLACISGQAAIFGNESDHPASPMKAVAELVEDGPRQFRASLNLGYLPSGRNIEIDVELRNRSNSLEISLNDSQATCGCIRAAVNKPSIPPGGTANMRLTVSTPKTRVKSSFWRQEVTFNQQNPENPANVRTVIQLQGELSGVLSFASDNNIVAVRILDDIDSTVRSTRHVIPIVFSPPVEFKNLVVRCNCPSEAISSVLRPLAEGSAEVQLSLINNGITNEGLNCEVEIEDPSTGAKAKAIVNVAKQPRIEILPNIVRLIKSDDGKTYRGSAFVINRLVSNADDSGNTPEPSIVAKLDGVPLRIETLRLTNSTIKIELHGPADSVNTKAEELAESTANGTREPKLSIHWEVFWAGAKSQCVTAVELATF